MEGECLRSAGAVRLGFEECRRCAPRGVFEECGRCATRGVFEECGRCATRGVFEECRRCATRGVFEECRRCATHVKLVQELLAELRVLPHPRLGRFFRQTRQAGLHGNQTTHEVLHRRLELLQGVAVVLQGLPLAGQSVDTHTSQDVM